MADEFMLTYKVESQTLVSRPSDPCSPPFPPRLVSRPAAPIKEEKECFYCHKLGRVYANCLALRRKEQSHSVSAERPSKGVGLNI